MPTPPPVQLLVGDDDLLRQRALERLLVDLRAAEPTLEVEHADAAEVAGLPEMRTASLFGGTRCVVLRNADQLAGRLADEVLSYVEEPTPGSVLVLEARRADRRQRLTKQVEKVGERHEVSAPKPWDDRAWEALARDELRRLDRSAEPAALRALLTHAGTDPSALASKSAQVAAATPAGSRVSAADVERVVEGHGNRGGFPVADAVADRDPAAAVVALRGALEAGEEPLVLLGAVTYRIRQLLQVRGGASPKQAGLSTGMHRRLQRTARRFHPGELPWCHDRLARADLELKTSDLPPDLVLELAVIDLATAREVGPPWNPLARGSGT
jgi:DNA polymerase-3 subunit delta